MTTIQKFYKDRLLIVFMNMKFLGCLFLIMVGLIGGVNASSSSVDVVNFTVGSSVENYTNDIFDGSISNLRVEGKGKDSISWIWRNSENGNFSYNLVFLDNSLVMNGSDEDFKARGLKGDRCYEISVVSVGKDGNNGPRVNDIACTLDDDNDGSVRVIKEANFDFTKDKNIFKNTTIILNSSMAEDNGFDWLVLLCWILGLLILILLYSIAVLSRK